MSSSLRKTLREVSLETLAKLFERTGVAMPADLPEGERRRTNVLHAAIRSAGPKAQEATEVICERIDKFVGDFADNALRQVARGDARLSAICDEDRGLRERTLLYLLTNDRAFLRAASLEHNQRLRERRDHDAFRVVLPAMAESEPPIDFEQLSQKLETILRQIDGSGRRIDFDHFTYPFDPSKPGDRPEVHHVAAYAQGNAITAPEFGDEGLAFIVRRPVAEISIDLDPHTGQLDIAGQKIGGHKTRKAIADAVCESFRAEGPPTPAEAHELDLDSLKRPRPFDVASMDGLQAIEVVSVTLEAPEDGAGFAKYNEGPQVNVWDRMAMLGVDEHRLELEEVSAAQLRLVLAPRGDDPHRQPVVKLQTPSTIDVSQLGQERWIVRNKLLPALGLLQPIPSGLEDEADDG